MDFRLFRLFRPFPGSSRKCQVPKLSLLTATLLTIFSLILLSSCGKEKPQPEPPPVSVTDYTVVKRNIPAVFEFIGFAKSSHPVEIRARVEGYLDQIAYDESKMVQQGQLLFQLDPSQFIAQVERAKGEVAKQKALLANANLTVDRLTPLYEKKAASKKDLDNAIASKLSTEAMLQSAYAQLMEAQLNLSYTTISSPITGYPQKSVYHEGALITPAPGNLMTTVYVLDPIWIYFTVSDTDILRARLASTDKSMNLPQEQEYNVEVIQSGVPFPHKGAVDYSSPEYDQATGTMQVRAVLPNPQNDIRPGEFVRVRVYGATRPDAIAVPLKSLIQQKDGMYVYLIGKDNKVIAQNVTTGDWYGEFQIITNGLKPGDRIVVDGTNKVRPGSTVQVIGEWKPTTPEKESVTGAPPMTQPSKDLNEQ